MNSVLMVLFCIFNACGVFLYGWLSIILMEVVLCKDARQIDTAKLFSKRFTTRMRLFKRSMGGMFYRGTFCLWIGCYIVLFIRLTELSGGVIPPTNSPRAIASMLIPYGVILLYKAWGHQSTLFSGSK